MQADLNEALQPRHWLRQFDRKTLERAQGYASPLHICHFAIVDEGDGAWVVAAKVQGSARRPYDVSVHLDQNDRGQYAYGTTCTCPVGYQCKHAAATLMFAAERQRASSTPTAALRTRPIVVETPAWQRWLAQIPAELPRIETTAAAPAPSGQFAVLFDRLKLGHGSGLLARPVLLAQGNPVRGVKPEPLREPQAYVHNPAPQLDDAAWQWFARLRMFSPQHQDGQAWYALSGARGEVLLRELLAAGVAYWRKPGAQPLRLGASRVFGWHWQLDAAGSQQLAPDLDAGSLLLPINGTWYVDTKLGELGPVQNATTVPRALLAGLPPVAAEESGAFAAAWSAHPLLGSLPAPRRLSVETITARPRAIVRLFARPVAARARRREAKLDLALLSLSFDYAGQRLPGPPQSGRRRFVQGDTVYVLERDAGAELGAEVILNNGGWRWLAQQYELRERSDVRGDEVYVALHGREPASLRAARQSMDFLREAGFEVEIDPDYPLQLLDASALPWYAEFDEGGGGAWFEGELGIEIDGERVSLLPILHAALESKHFGLTPSPEEPADAVLHVNLDERRVLQLPFARLRALLAPLAQWLGPDQRLKLPRVAAAVIDEIENDARLALTTRTSQNLRALAQSLRERHSATAPKLPKSFAAELRAYQRDGVQWLGFLARHQLGGVLADDMGLGKTVQILAHLACEKAAKRLTAPALVVAPTSVVGNWVEQARRFAPRLRLIVLQGLDRHGHFDALADCDIALTSYALLPRDREQLKAQRFTVAIFDEAQALKNAKSQAAAVARELDVGRRVAVTGTPLENHLGELWAQFDLVLPGLLGDATRFNRLLRTPIEKHADAEAQARLNRRIAPFVLRRNKEQVAKELPPKTEIIQTVELGAGQRELYESLRLTMHDKVRDAIQRRGLAQSAIVVLDALLKLRQACCDPRLVKLPAAGKVKHSAKLELLMEMLEELTAEGRRILLFSQFTGMLDLIEQALDARGYDRVRLDGSTRDRETPIRRFQAFEVPLFLISLKAGGVGLNLTAADTVIHYDPWWNPAVERQATDRAHRIGQDKPVFVYKLIASGTVEEKIQALQQRKAALAQAVLEGGTREKLSFSEDDVEALFSPV